MLRSRTENTMSSSSRSNYLDRVRHSSEIRDICIFAMLGSIMFASKVIMEALPNIHLLGMLTMTYTIVYRKRALIPIYVYVMLNGLFAGFNAWWVPYLYIWTLLWGVTMLLPKNMPRWAKYTVYPVVCSLHGFAFGILYAPAQALFFGLDFKTTIAWIIAGAPFDTIHGISNFVAGFAIAPISELISKFSKGQFVRQA